MIEHLDSRHKIEKYQLGNALSPYPHNYCKARVSNKVRVVPTLVILAALEDPRSLSVPVKHQTNMMSHDLGAFVTHLEQTDCSTYKKHFTRKESEAQQK